MRNYGLIIRVITLFFMISFVCTFTGAITIQTELQYPSPAVNPNSSPVSVGTDAFTNSVTQNIQKPLKTNGWLSPILWADSTTLIYPDNNAIINGDQHPLYQLPVYPVPWSIYYAKVTLSEVDRFNKLNQIDPEDPNSPVPQGLFIRKMPVFSLYDTQQFTPLGSHDPTNSSYNMYALSGMYTSPAIEVSPGFNASFIKVNRMGDWDAQLLLQASDDPDKPVTIPQTASLYLDTGRGSPYIQFTAIEIPELNFTFWHGNSFIQKNGSLSLQGNNISWYQITTPMRSSGVPAPMTSWSQNQYWENQTYILFIPTDNATVSVENLPDELSRYQQVLFSKDRLSVSFSQPEEENYLAIAVIDNPDEIDETLLSTLAEGAFCYPTGSKTSYQYSQQNATVTVDYNLETNNVLGISGTPVQGIMPIHYGSFFDSGPVLTSPSSFVHNESGVDTILNTIKGKIRLIKGDTFTCTYRYPGILPYMPGLPALDTEGIETLTQWMSDISFLYTRGSWEPWKYTGMNNLYDTYGAGKIIWSAANLNRVAAGISNATVEEDTETSTKKSLELFFNDSPQRITTDQQNQQAPYYSYYDTNANTLLLYPAGTTPGWPPNEERYLQWDGYGSVTKLNDHHYTYGYYVSAAALMAFADSNFGEEYKYVINQLIFDIAYDPDTCSQIPHLSFPKTRLWDPYLGHCEASGMIYSDISGNSDESISEEIQFWAGVIRWGTATDQDEITNLGITRYTQAVYAYYTYWRDHFGAYPELWNQAKGSGFNPGWISPDYVPQIWDGKAKTSTFFGTYPTGETVITTLPITSASFYHAMDKNWINSYIAAYEAYIKKFNMDPQNPQGMNAMDTKQPWYSQLAYYGELACWYAMTDPEGSLSKFFPLDPNTALNQDPTYQTLPINTYTEKGKDAAQVYQFVRFLQDYGVPEPLLAYATNTPYSMVFVKNGVNTYVAFNPDDEKKDITFNDGTVISNVSPLQFGFWPVGYPETVNASFTMSPTSGTAPLQVTFTDTSRGSLIKWEWTFGDNTSSNEQNPVHTFTSTGTFDVVLTVTDVNRLTSTTSQSIQVSESGKLPGNFSISTYHSGTGVCGLFPSLIINENTSYFSFFNTENTGPYNTGANGTIGVGKIRFNPDNINISKEENAVNLVYASYPPGVPQPEWGRTSIALDNDGIPLIAYLDMNGPSGTYPQKLHLAWENADNSWSNITLTDKFPWNPSLAVSQGGIPGIGFPSGTGKNPNYVFPTGPDYTIPPWGVIPIEPDGNQQTFTPDTLFTTYLITGTGQTSRMVYYNSSMHEIRHAWMPNSAIKNQWTIESVLAGVNAGWVSAAYNPDTDILGICWYELTNKTLMYTEKPLSGTWGSAVVVDSSGHDVGSNCSLAYGPDSGILPGPGISYYDATGNQLMFAWKDTGGWEHIVVDGNGAGTSSSLAYSQDGYPHIAYRHEGSNALKYAYLTKGTGIEASFTSDVRTGNVPLTVHFSDTTLNNSEIALQTILSDDEYGVHYWWDLNGDGQWEAEDIENPVYTYEAPGLYDVKMLIHIKLWLFFPLDIYGIVDMGDYINATSIAPISANFTAVPISGTPPLNVSFTDTSTGSPSSWNWTFGDGSVSNEQNPIHTYSGIGRYTVTLEVAGSEGSDIIRKPVSIDVNAGPQFGPSGMLQVKSIPSGAQIFIDSVFQGVTPVDGLIVKAGKHNLALQLDGYQKWTEEVQVQPGMLKIIPTVKLH